MRRSAGYTLVELFLTLAVVMILLGMMINLAGRVRHESAARSTRLILARLTQLINEYQRQNNGELPPIRPVIRDDHRPTEDALQAAALANNADLVQYLNLQQQSLKNSNDPLYGSVRVTETKTVLLEDPWGSPVVFMPRQNPAIGMAPGDTFFLFSAGPDKLFLTQEDNVYSYEDLGRNAE